MALDPIVNFFRSTIATLPVASGGTSIVLQTGDGNKLPAPAIDGAFNLTIYNADDPFVAPEIVRVTARSGDTLTVTRAQEGTSATNKTSGSTWNVELTPTAKTIQDIDSAKLDVAGGTMTGDLTIPDKIIHSGDTNTAIRFPAADTVAVETAGVERMRVDSSGRVGIGVTPSDRLHVKSTSTLNHLRIDGPAGINRNVAIVTDNVNRWNIYASSLAETGSNAGSDLSIARYSDAGSFLNVPFIIVRETGFVGINRTAPATTLDVNGDVTITDKIIHSGDTNTAIRFPSADTFTVETSGSEALRVDSSQRVGIQNTNPSHPLDVTGVARATEYRMSTTQRTFTKQVSVPNDTNTVLLTFTTPSGSGAVNCLIYVSVVGSSGGTARLIGNALYSYRHINVRAVPAKSTGLVAVEAFNFSSQNTALVNITSTTFSDNNVDSDTNTISLQIVGTGSSPTFTVNLHVVALGPNPTIIT